MVNASHHVMPCRVIEKANGERYVIDRAQAFDELKSSLTRQLAKNTNLVSSVSHLERDLCGCLVDLFLVQGGILLLGAQISRINRQVTFLDKMDLGIFSKRPERVTAATLKLLSKLPWFKNKLVSFRQSRDARQFEAERDIREAIAPLSRVLLKVAAVMQRCCAEKLISRESPSLQTITVANKELELVIRRPDYVTEWWRKCISPTIAFPKLLAALRDEIEVAIKSQNQQNRRDLLAAAGRENVGCLERYVARLPRHDLSEAEVACLAYKFYKDLGDQTRQFSYIEQLGLLAEKTVRKTVARLERGGILDSAESQELLSWIQNSPKEESEQTTQDGDELDDSTQEIACPPKPLEVEVAYAAFNGKTPFKDWLTTLSASDRCRVEQRVERFIHGNIGDFKSITSSSFNLFQARLHFGAHYRIYFTRPQRDAIFIVCAGSKSSQDEDIRKADSILSAIPSRGSDAI